MESAEANNTYHDNELGKVMQQVGDKALAWAESLDLRPHHAVLFVILTITLKWLLYIIRVKAATRPPGPAFTVPLVGETLEYIRRPSTFIFKRLQKYGGTFRTHLLGYSLYIPGDTEFNKRVAHTPMHDPDAQEFQFMVPGKSFEKLLAPDLAQVTQHDPHVAFRKLVGGALSPAALGRLLPELQAIAEAHVARWGAAGHVAIEASGKDLALDFAMDVLTGIPHDKLDKPYMKSQYLAMLAGLYSIPIDLPGTPLWHGKRAVRALVQALGPAMAQELASFQATVSESEEPAPESLSITWAQFLADRTYSKLSDELAVKRALGNFIGAADTTRFALFTVLSCIALSTRVQARIREEQKQVLLTHGSAISVAAISSMEYLEASIREALRLMPAANGQFRRALKDVRTGGYVIPKGSVVYWSTHMPCFLDNAVIVQNDGGKGGMNVGPSGLPEHMDFVDRFELAYKPERWLSPDTRPRQYSTFGFGNHLCLGMNLVHMELKLVLALLLRRYSVTARDPRLLAKATWFPGPTPAAGTDVMDLTPVPV